MPEKRTVNELLEQAQNLFPERFNTHRIRTKSGWRHIWWMPDITGRDPWELREDVILDGILQAVREHKWPLQLQYTGDDEVQVHIFPGPVEKPAIQPLLAASGHGAHKSVAHAALEAFVEALEMVEARKHPGGSEHA